MEGNSLHLFKPYVRYMMEKRRGPKTDLTVEKQDYTRIKTVVLGFNWTCICCVTLGETLSISEPLLMTWEVILP